MLSETVVPQFSTSGSYQEMPGHWLLASMGKRVLRPGGLELSEWMITNLSMNEKDDVVEFAPGLGRTAEITLKIGPHTYTGIERDEDAAAVAASVIQGPNRTIKIADAMATGLPDEHASKAYGEAFLTMQSSRVKVQILKEVARILKPGGLYGMHELSLTTESNSQTLKAQKDLTESIRVNARPISLEEWRKVLDAAGFEVIKTKLLPMSLLEPRRLLEDEGFLGLARLLTNLARNPKALARVMEMRRTFRRQGRSLKAIGIIARKKFD